MKYGYEIINGKYVVSSIKADIINKSAQSYLNGISLKSIAEELTNNCVEYAQGKSLWNKNRVRRMLTDTAYLGTDMYPAIMKREVFDEIEKVMDLRNTQKNTNRDEIFSSAIVPICCGNCGSETIRKYESRTKRPSVYHKCLNPECNKKYKIDDMDLRTMVREKLAMCEDSSFNASEDIIREIHRLDNEIERDLQSISIDEVAMKNKIFECAALKYRQYNTPKESIDYSKMNLCSLNFNREVKSRVKTVVLESNDNIWLYLTDGRIVGKEVADNECCT